MLRPTMIEKLLSLERERDSEFYFETLSVINYIHVSRNNRIEGKN